MKYIINTDNSKDNITSVYIMEERGKSFCMLSYYEREKHIMSFSNLDVSNNFRNMGYGDDLLNFAIEYAKNHGCEYLYLFTIDKDSWITKWYKRHGFIAYKEENTECYLYLKINNYVQSKER